MQADEGDEISALLNSTVEADEGDAISVILKASIESNSKKSELSPEDAAWADSCLVSDPQLSQDNWDDLREALLEALSPRVVFDDEEEPKASINEIAEENIQARELAEDEEATEERKRTSEFAQGEAMHNTGDFESQDNIFKVWEIETTQEDEENELIKQLKKALRESKFQDDKILEVDELIANMGDLSIEPPSQ
ncbi:uncharacterized protein LOC109823018 isoform X2 [Asparagus officinalis]|nr:uncharacterized protein LOC109823018 isoform X2 [Asparagus officinalis]